MRPVGAYGGIEDVGGGGVEEQSVLQNIVRAPTSSPVPREMRMPPSRRGPVRVKSGGIVRRPDAR